MLMGYVSFSERGQYGGGHWSDHTVEAYVGLLFLDELLELCSSLTM